MPSSDPDRTTQITATLGRILGDRYTLAREVGRGGMSLVFLAHDRKHDRPVAVKVLREEVSANLGAERFLKEIGMAARLQHPHIVPIYDSGGSESLLYFVMPYLDGESLRERLERDGRLSLEETLRYGLEVAEALSYAHSRHVVHRDVKPENIILVHGHALVLDFGIAKAMSEKESDTVTLEGMFVGTPSYMAPEQMFGDTPVDERADVYALASVLYEALEGAPPFVGASSTAILSKKAVQVATAPQKTLEKLPPHVEAALLRALEREREHRFDTISEFAEALSTAPRPSGRPAPRRSGGTVLQSIAVLPFVNGSGDPANEFLSDGISEDLIHALSALPTLRVVARTSAFAFKGRAVDVRNVGAELGVGTVLTGSVRRSGDRLRITADLIDVASGFALWSERFDRDLTDVFAVQDEISQAIVSTLRVRLLGESERLVDTPTTNFAAYESYLKGRFEWGQRTSASMQRALEHLQSAIDTDPTFLLAQSGLADCYLTLAIYGIVAPGEAMTKAGDAAERVLTVQPRSAEALTARASVRALHTFDWARAEDDYIAALAEREQYPVTHQWYAMHYLAPRGRFGEARAHVSRARELDPLSPSIAASAGILRLYERDASQALREIELVLSQHPSFGLAHLFHGFALVELGEHQAAVAAMERAAVLTGESAETRSALGFACGRAGDLAGARALLASLEETRKDTYVSPVLFAQIHAALGEHGAALDQLEEAVRVKSTDLSMLLIRPSFDALRSEPRFAAIIDLIRG